MLNTENEKNFSNDEPKDINIEESVVSEQDSAFDEIQVEEETILEDNREADSEETVAVEEVAEIEDLSEPVVAEEPIAASEELSSTQVASDDVTSEEVVSGTEDNELDSTQEEVATTPLQMEEKAELAPISEQFPEEATISEEAVEAIPPTEPVKPIQRFTPEGVLIQPAVVEAEDEVKTADAEVGLEPVVDHQTGGGSGNGGGGEEPPHGSGQDPVPPKKSKGWAIGLAGGVIGALLASGVFFTVAPKMIENYMKDNQIEQSTNLDDDTKKVQTVSTNVTSEVTDAVEKVEGAVVSVSNLQSGVSNSGYFDDERSSSSSDDLELAGEGSGVIYKEKDGTAYIVTNNHVVEGAEAVEVTLNDGTKAEAKIVGTDEWTDLAVLSISSDDVTTVAQFGDSDDVKAGEPAIAIGSPLGSSYAGSVTQGIVSATNRTIEMDTNNDGVADFDMTAIQTDAAINPGNSGGALINIAGDVIGINSMKFASSEIEGMGFAIPSNDVVKIISQLEKEGEVVRPALGVTLRDLSTVSSQQQKDILELPDDITEGVVIMSVSSGGSADEAGLKKYDTIVKIDDTDITSSISLRKVIYNAAVGDKVKVTFYRDGELQTKEITLQSAKDL